MTEYADIVTEDGSDPNLEDPTHCDHDVLRIMAVGRDEVSAEDAVRLGHLGFFWSEEDAWVSFKFGSA